MIGFATSVAFLGQTFDASIDDVLKFIRTVHEDNEVALKRVKETNKLVA